MSYQLSDKTKELLSKRIGIPYEKLIQMEDEEIDAYIEQKTGKKITWLKVQQKLMVYQLELLKMWIKEWMKWLAKKIVVGTDKSLIYDLLDL